MGASAMVDILPGDKRVLRSNVFKAGSISLHSEITDASQAIVNSSNQVALQSISDLPVQGLKVFPQIVCAALDSVGFIIAVLPTNIIKN